MDDLTDDIQRYSYQSRIIDRLRAAGFRLELGRLTILCAQKFGFCWGVDKAVSMVHEAIATGGYRRIWLLSQIIHNPTVNQDLLARGVGFLKGEGAAPGAFGLVTPDDLVVIPAFSAEIDDLERVKAIGCRILDTTCPWVERPHRRTESLIGEGFTLIIHGKVGHDETRSTCSLIRSRGGRYLVVLNVEEVDAVCGYLRGEVDAKQLAARFARATSPDFDPDRDLQRVGLINQTTMLASESREIGRRLEAAMRARHRTGELRPFLRDFDTIYSGTQENQDAVLDLVQRPELDLMLVVGGYESSNTNNLARVAAGRVPTYHIEDASALGPGEIEHKALDGPELIRTRDWLRDGPLTIGFSAGASTPDGTLGNVILRVADIMGVDTAPLVGEQSVA